MTVYLVGAGPGDPGLLTRRGAALLAGADVVVYDRLVDPAVLSLAGPRSVLIDVGKRPGAPGPRTVAGSSAGEEAPTGAGRQDEINRLLVEQGRRGLSVVRLKGGDPFLFGRGGEEAEALGAAGVPWVVVPGVTSAVALPAVAGVPVTHRGVSSSVTVVTGQVGDPEAPGQVDWGSLARAGGTLVVLMGVAARADVARRLREGGRADDTPVAVVEAGTTARQRIVRTTLGQLGASPVSAPAVMVVGAVAALDLSAGGGELAGSAVVVTRARAQSAALVAALSAAGARVLEVPAIELVAPADGGAALAAAAAGVAGYDWVAFASANAVERFVPLLRDVRDLATTRLAAVGAATAAALARYHLRADLVPEHSTAEGLAAAFPETSGGARALLPRAAEGREALAAGLRARGWHVDEVVAYRTVTAPGPPAVLAAQLEEADAVTFTSPSTVSAYGVQRDTGGRALPRPPVAVCVGPTTAAAARAAGWSVVVEAGSPSPSAMVAALARQRRGGPTGGVTAAE